ncbi:type IV secretory system conjugative DNA transfer family protein, partial [uncultured Intestinimonas sp.]|uniref:type IV secretory system conjugative DNA transfer family protein n=1 Tax=uncultured Intestinimonas sp. TaxID=1689265 RepID=UPI0025E9104B
AALSPVKTKNDPFWEQAAQMALSAMISYVLEYLPRQEHHLGSVIRLLREMGNGSFDRLFEEVCTFAPDSFAAAQYQMLRNIQKSPRTYASIQAFLAEKLSPFAFHGAEKLFTNSSQLYFQSLGDRKTAVFLTISDTDRSMDALVTLFYTPRRFKLSAAMPTSARAAVCVSRSALSWTTSPPGPQGAS